MEGDLHYLKEKYHNIPKPGELAKTLLYLSSSMEGFTKSNGLLYFSSLTGYNETNNDNNDIPYLPDYYEFKDKLNRNVVCK